jgi:hypothetical protein
MFSYSIALYVLLPGDGTYKFDRDVRGPEQAHKLMYVLAAVTFAFWPPLCS